MEDSDQLDSSASRLTDASFLQRASLQQAGGNNMSQALLWGCVTAILVILAISVTYLWANF